MEKKIMGSTSAYSSGIALFPYLDRVRVQQPNYAYKNQIIEKLQELVRLEQGWDGYKAQPVSLDNAMYAVRILETICSNATPLPDIFPGVNGDLQLEWHTEYVQIELHIISPNKILFWANDSSMCLTDQETLITGSDFTGVSSQLAKLAEGKSDYAARA
jgi:hypothetical protein